jgi:predicted AAA+ superfamily ATPase
VLAKLLIEQVIDSQKERLTQLNPGLKRELSGIYEIKTHALIVTGIRRCGKSTLLQQINKSISDQTLYLNFEDPRLTGFDQGDFNRLHEIAMTRGIFIYLFDEIQIVDKWEGFVRFRLDEGYRVYITGSNASMLSKELGTKLTGRHIPKELFPFSYNEYLTFTGHNKDAVSAERYMHLGGFPEMVKTEMPEVLMNLFNDILIRDISIRYSVKNILSLQHLAVWLISNSGKQITGNSLKKIFSIGSSSSIMEYLSYFSNAWLFFFVPKFSYSHKVQIVNPKKVYSIDNGLINANSISFSNDVGRLMENMVFMELRRKTDEIYYFNGKKECDFVVFNNGKLSGLYQVCLQLGSDNFDRELAGLKEAMDYFKVKKGTIITQNQTDLFTIDGKIISALPFYDWAVSGIGG